MKSMTLSGVAGLAVCGVLLALTVDVGQASIMATPSRAVTTRERIEYYVDWSTIVVLARVIRAESWEDKNGRGWKFEIEPLTYFKGGLDGELVEVRHHSREVMSQAEYDRITRPYLNLAGKPTSAGVFFLRSHEGAWYLDPTVVAFLELAPLQALQSGWKALADSLEEIIAHASLESTLRRADVVAIGHFDAKAAQDNRRANGPVPLILDTTLAGKSSRSVRVRTLWGEFPDGQHLVCLKRGKDGVYEPIPFTRTVLSVEEKPGRGIVLGDKRLNEVKSILARVRPEATPPR